MSLFESLFGGNVATSWINPQSQQAVNQAFNTAYNQYQQQSQLGNNQTAAAQQYAQAAHQYNMAQLGRPRHEDWMFNGKSMTLTEFADAVWSEDDPAKTMFLLKYTK